MSSMQSSYITDKRENVPGCLVLIFSTDRDFIQHHCEMFASLGFKPVTATTPEAATGFLRMLVVALVVLDQESGTPEGCQILRRTRDLQYHAPVLVIGRKYNPNFRDKTLSLGAADYLDHPALPDDVIHALLPSHRRQKGPVSSVAFQPGTHGRGVQ